MEYMQAIVLHHT